MTENIPANRSERSYDLVSRALEDLSRKEPQNNYFSAEKIFMHMQELAPRGPTTPTPSYTKKILTDLQRRGLVDMITGITGKASRVSLYRTRARESDKS